MKQCCKCGEGVVSGFIICKECHENSDAPLMFYIDQLAEDITLNYPLASCKLCIRGSCDSQQSGLTCRGGVKAFLMSRIKEYADNFKTAVEENKRYFDYLDRESVTKPIDRITSQHALIQAFPELNEFHARAVISIWRDIRGK